MILTDANIIDIGRGSVLQKQDVRIRDGVIVQVVAGIETGDEEVVDCAGRYLMPALCDMHVHLDAPAMPALLLACGVTRVRNMWGRTDVLALRERAKDPGYAGPSIRTTSPIIDGVASLTGCRVVTTPRQAREAVAEYEAAGYDCIKTYPDIPREAFLALADEAARRSLRVVGHGNRHVSTEELIGSGYAAIEHASCLPGSEDDISKIARSGMWFIPTFVTLENVVEFANGRKTLCDVTDSGYVDRRTGEIWADNIVRFRAEERFSRFSMEAFSHKAKLFLNHSGRILMGTDAPMPGTIAGFSAHRELQLLVTLAGLTPAQALRAATANAALYFGEENKRGAVEPGHAADLLLLDANPLEDIGNSSAISWVAKAGTIYDRAKLDDLLRQVIAAAAESGSMPRM